MVLASGAMAQDLSDTAAAVDPETADDAIIVTGSRLARDPNAVAPSPINVISSADIAANGSQDATAALRQIPALISSRTVADSIERPGGGVGQATLDLRQLGANRTLVLVDGYRHVSGVAGSQTVDVSTIPTALIDRVDVLTGGASAVYGADAVTGVVNYILKKDFEGLQLNAQSNFATSGSGGGQSVDLTYGKNFIDGRGNITFSAGYTLEQEVLFGDRPFTRDNGRGNNSTTYQNPLLRFQRGDIDPASMPNFARRFSSAQGRLPFGYVIPLPGTAAYNQLFPTGTSPTAAELSLINRALAAPSFVIRPDPRFGISSGQGLIFRADYGFFNADINNNGVNDCRESYIGLTGFGGGGCYVSTPGGGVKIFEDGVVSTGSNQFGGDGAVERTNQTSLVPQSERIFANLRLTYDFSPGAEFFLDAKYARNNTVSRNNYNTFYDSLLIRSDNPFIPAALRADALAAEDALGNVDANGNPVTGLRVSRDFLDLGPNIQRAERDTYRVVAGLRGEVTSNLDYELVANYGRTDSAVSQSNSVLYDRLFAALDVVTGPNGQPICRSDIDRNSLYPGSEVFPVIAPGYFTFRPGDGQCKPANILGGENSLSPEAVAFITTPTTDLFGLEQFVVSATIKGDTSGFFNLPGGPVQFAVGGEYRREESSSRFSDFELGILPEGSPAGPAGTFIGDVSPNQSLLFDASTRTLNTGGSFDVKEVFGEISIPLLADVPLFDELTIDAAGRYADYSTIGGAFTWTVNGIWAPVQDVRVRGTYSRAIRAPNIAELFSPAQGATFRPSDPCDVVNQNATPNRLQNCIAEATALGIPNAAAFIAGYSDPLTARFSGTSGGNTALKEESATTWTAGAVIQPRFLRGLTISADYYSISIEDAIAVVTAQDIVNTCYDNVTFPNQFCDLFERNGPTAGATTFGFNFLRQTQLNFGRIETSGVDFTVNYAFSLGDHNFNLRGGGNWTEKVDRFFDPVDTTLVNPGLNELGAPEWSGLGSFTYGHKGFGFNYTVQYVGRQALATVIQIERIDREFGAAGWAREYFVHNASISLKANDQFTLNLGLNNITDAKPYLASSAYPVNGIGRMAFVGIQGAF
ncbi:TonB-dependent receptor [Sphingomonas sp. BGYR3]|uniref:TonB-dependent receptor domain-containing protein n=1 Tax=Sphingomonas sp. BGYR3 TaxID=2975483 RepID=UPI0021A9291C|nr:TonB-dependent receptor [Sphingomonas sp. BGYR3]MDG5487300.1 TonB-dependent receptor [Sphingomonas sp. BGYR3]